MRRRDIAVSALVHGVALLALVLMSASVPVVRTRTPGLRTGAVIALTYNPGGAGPSTQPARKRQLAKAGSPSNIAGRISVAKTRQQTAPGASGESPLGDGDISLALLRFSPDPQPDLSTLPTGTNGNVVIDVVIDAEGRIAESTLVHGVGDMVDRTVLATVQSWTFLPATKDGVPIASKREIVFHYERS